MVASALIWTAAFIFIVLGILTLHATLQHQAAVEREAWVLAHGGQQPPVGIRFAPMNGESDPTAPGCGHVMSKEIFNKWMALNGKNGVLRCATADDREAARSPQGTEGRVAFG